MEASFFWRGLVIGFSIAAPVGPIGILCIRRTLTEGRASGFVSGLGAATADAIYGAVGGFGIAYISTLLISHRGWFRLIGGVFLCYLGIRTMLARPAGDAAVERGNGLVAAYASTLFLTLTNPMTILSFAAVFAGLGIASAAGHYASAGVLVLGVFVGSALWWLALSSGVGVLRTRFSPRGLSWVNRIAGVIITGFGVIALVGFEG